MDRQRHGEILEESRQIGALDVVRRHAFEATAIHVRTLTILRGDHTVGK